MRKLSQEFKDLENYFRLARYRDETDYFLPEEYEELEEIIKRSSRAKEMEKARTDFYLGRITEEKYKEICDSHYAALEEAYKEIDKEEQEEKKKTTMESKKSWEEFTSEEKTTLLNHWFYYYGGVVMTLKDMEEFRKISSTRQDDIFDHIVTNFIFKKTIQSNVLVLCMREKKLDELFSHSLNREQIKEEDLEAFSDVRGMLSNEILSTFIYPEPPVPMDIDIEIVVKGPIKQKKRRNKKPKEE